MRKYAIFTTGLVEVPTLDTLKDKDEELLSKQYFNSIRDARTELEKYESVIDRRVGPYNSEILFAERVYVREYKGSAEEFAKFTWPFTAVKGRVVFIQPYKKE